MKVYRVTTHPKGWAVTKQGGKRPSSIHNPYKGRGQKMPYRHALIEASVKMGADIVYVHDKDGRIDFVWAKFYDITMNAQLIENILKADALLKSSVKKKKAAAQERSAMGFDRLDETLRSVGAHFDEDRKSFAEAGRKISEKNGHADLCEAEALARNIIIPQLAKLIRETME